MERSRRFGAHVACLKTADEEPSVARGRRSGKLLPLIQRCAWLEENANGESYPIGIWIPDWAASYAANILVATIVEETKMAEDVHLSADQILGDQLKTFEDPGWPRRRLRSTLAREYAMLIDIYMLLWYLKFRRKPLQ